MANYKFFQMRQMTKSLDQTYDDDIYLLKQLHYSALKNNITFYDLKILEEQALLDEWDVYKVTMIKKLISDTHNSTNPQYKICLCEFAESRRLSMELWIKMAYDIFNDELDGRNLRFKFWNYLQGKSRDLNEDLSAKKWPKDWEYLSAEPCLCLEMLKLYEQYPQIRPFLAEHINNTASDYIYVDVRRMPILIEDKGVEIDFSRRTWFPKLTICSPAVLESLYYSNSIFGNHILKFCMVMKEIVTPLFAYFQRNEAGTVVNIYGEEHSFIFEVLYSIKAACGLAVRVTSGSLRIPKSSKGNADMRAKEDQCKIILSDMSQMDVNEEVLQDIFKNVQEGYNVFSTRVQGAKQDLQPKLVLMISERKLNMKVARQDDIIYHKIPDETIQKLLTQIDYPFLVHYCNLLFNKVMVVQQSGGQRKPFFQIMLCMWAYVIPMYFSNKNPSLIEHKIFKIMQEIEQNEQAQISLEVSEEESCPNDMERVGNIKKIKFE